MEVFWFEAPEQTRLEIWQMSPQGQMLHVRADITDYVYVEEAAAAKSA